MTRKFKYVNDILVLLQKSATSPRITSIFLAVMLGILLGFLAPISAIGCLLREDPVILQHQNFPDDDSRFYVHDTL